MICIELGHKKLCYLVGQKKGKSLLIKRAEVLDFDKDIFSEPDTAVLTKQIKAFLKQKKLPVGQAQLIINHRDVVYKELSLPIMTRKEIDDGVLNDTSRIARFAKTPYSYAYSFYYEPGRRDIRLFYVVTAKNILDRAIKLVESVGFNIRHLSVAPIHFFNLPVKKSKDHDTAMLIFYDRMSYVVIYNGQECKGIYTADSGIEDLYSSQTSEFDDHRFRSLAEEIKRIIKSYEADRHGVIAETLVFVDHRLSENITEKISVVLGARPVHDPELPKGVKTDHTKTPLPLNGIFFGALAQSLETRAGNPCFNESRIWNYQKTPGYRTKCVSALISMICVISVLFALPLLKVLQESWRLGRTHQALSLKVKEFENKTAELSKERNKHLDIKKHLLGQINTIQELRFFAWDKAFITISEILPKDAWLSSFSLSPNGSIQLQGSAMTLDSVAAFIRALKDKDFFVDIRLRNTKERSVSQQTVRDFDIVLTLLKSESFKK